MSSQDYKDYRREYEAQGLRRQELALDPWQQFSHWLSEAEVACPLDVTSMSLATVSASGMPSARMVLMKSYDNNGLVWYTDSRSYKGQDIAHNPQASVLFYWHCDRPDEYAHLYDVNTVRVNTEDLIRPYAVKAILCLSVSSRTVLSLWNLN